MATHAYGGLYKKLSILDRPPRSESEVTRENRDVVYAREQEHWRARQRRHQGYDLAMQESLYCTDDERFARQQQVFAEAQEQLALKQCVRQEVDQFAAPIGWTPESAQASRRRPVSEESRQPLPTEGPACSGLSNIGKDSEDFTSARRRLQAAQIKQENLQVAAEAASRRRLQAEQDKHEFRATFTSAQRGRSPGVLG